MDPNVTTIDSGDGWAILQRLDRDLQDGSIRGADYGLFETAERGYVNPRLSVTVRLVEDGLGSVFGQFSWTGVHGANSYGVAHIKRLLTLAEDFLRTARMKPTRPRKRR